MAHLNQITLPAPAKLNLFLHITARRADGYHELQTIFQFLDWADTLHFSLRHDDIITLSPNLEGVASDDNLIVKAARMLQSHTGCRLGADIHLEKCLPMGGGIGGGSSDAATTLLALNQLWQCGLSLTQLAELGITLGADVPIFIHGKAAFAEGVGEKLQPVTPDEHWYVIIRPNVAISTAKIFNYPTLKRDTPALKIDQLDNATLRNDCQKTVCDLYPEVEKALAWLLKYAPSKMTGTGSCVYGQFADEASARNALTQLPQEMTGYVAQGRNLSPAHHQLAQMR